MAKTSTIEIPFPILRLFLPADGEVTTHVLKADKWRNEETPFFRHECVEFAFGKKLRAKMEDRNKESWWKPGLVDIGDKVTVQGGWRVHKQIPAHSDYFDGTFQTNLTIATEQGLLTPKISKLDIEWNKSSAGKILAPVVEAIEPHIEKQLEKLINKFLKDLLPKLINEFFATDNLLKDIKARSTLGVKGTTIVLTVRVD